MYIVQNPVLQNKIQRAGKSRDRCLASISVPSTLHSSIHNIMVYLSSVVFILILGNTHIGTPFFFKTICILCRRSSPNLSHFNNNDFIPYCTEHHSPHTPTHCSVGCDKEWNNKRLWFQSVGPRCGLAAGRAVGIISVAWLSHSTPGRLVPSNPALQIESLSVDLYPCLPSLGRKGKQSEEGWPHLHNPL